MKPLKAIFKDSMAKAIEAQENLKDYSKNLEESEYALKVVKILKEDKASQAVGDILQKVRNCLEATSERIKDSFSFIDK